MNFGFQALNSGFFASGAWIPDSKAQDSDSTRNYFQDSGIWIPFTKWRHRGIASVPVSPAFKISDIVV